MSEKKPNLQKPEVLIPLLRSASDFGDRSQYAEVFQFEAWKPQNKDFRRGCVKAGAVELCARFLGGDGACDDDADDDDDVDVVAGGAGAAGAAGASEGDGGKVITSRVWLAEKDEALLKLCTAVRWLAQFDNDGHRRLLVEAGVAPLLVRLARQCLEVEGDGEGGGERFVVPAPKASQQRQERMLGAYQQRSPSTAVHKEAAFALVELCGPNLKATDGEFESYADLDVVRQIRYEEGGREVIAACRQEASQIGEIKDLDKKLDRVLATYDHCAPRVKAARG